MTFREYLRRIKGPTIKVTIAFIIISVLITAVFGLNLFGSADFLQEIVDEIMGTFDGLIASDGTIDPLALIFNNIRVCFIALGVGIVPFLYLPAIILLVNAGVIGTILGFFSLESISTLVKTVVFGILPHGILELPAIFISLACGFLLCHTITKKILRRNTDMRVSDVLINSLITVIFVCVPLMIVAGIIEVFITPGLLMMVM